MAPQTQTLTPKESSLFRTVVRCYEERQFKRGLKTADLILKKNPRHGNTMAMKALILNSQGKTDDAFALAKEALTCDMKSHVCWHTYGLLYRNIRNYEEAIKAYRFALKLEPESMQIQRDLSSMQIQMRDYGGYIASRFAMVQARPQLRMNWTALAVAHHMAGNLPEAERVLKTYEDTLKNPPSRLDPEHNEAVLYKTAIMAEQGEYQRAFDYLESVGKRNPDRLAVLEMRAGFLAKLGRQEEAAEAYRVLLDRNPDHPAYYEGLVTALGLPEDDGAARKAVFDEYADKSAKCDVARRIPLDFLTGDAFREAAQKYVIAMLEKGVPSTFANLKHLYSDSFRTETLASIVLDYIENSKAEVKPAEGDPPPSSDEGRDKGKTAALYFMAQHYNYHLTPRDLDKAEKFADSAISAMPTNVDFHMVKARIYKHRGNLQRASEIMDHARTLDLKDRYINSKASRYQQRNNEVEKAVKTMSLFTRSDMPGGPMGYILDLQSVYWLTEDGEAYERLGNIGMALKRYHEVLNVFETWHEDQLDFHMYALRKGQVRAYIDLLRWEDSLQEHPLYARLALHAARLYLRMHDQRVDAATECVNGTGGDDGSSSAEADAAEQKKVAKKARKELQRLEREAVERESKADPNKGTREVVGAKAKKDEDPLGLKLAATEDPLGVAMKFLGPLLQFSYKLSDAQLLGFDIYLRRKKYLLALRCLNAARTIDDSHPRVHEQSILLRYMLDGLSDDGQPAPKAAEVLAEAFAWGPEKGADLLSLNREFKAKHTGEGAKNRVAHALAAAAAERGLGGERAGSEQALVDLIGAEETSWQEAILVVQTLKAWRAGGGRAEEARRRGEERWPDVTRFKA